MFLHLIYNRLLLFVNSYVVPNLMLNKNIITYLNFQVVCFSYYKINNNLKDLQRPVIILLTSSFMYIFRHILFIFLTSWSQFFLRFRGIQQDVVGEGTHFMIPWVQSPIIFDIRARPKNVPTITGILIDKLQATSTRRTCSK